MWILLSLLNIFFAYLAEIHFCRNRQISICALLCIVIVNTIILGFRDFGVGTDTLAYVKDYFECAGNLHDFADLMEQEFYDKGYLLLAWMSRLFSDDPQALLLFTELFIISFMMLGVYEARKVLRYNVMWFMIFFVLLYQHETINLMRQFCSMSILFYGYSLLLQKKSKSYLLCQLIAFFFHSSSILFAIIPVFQYLSNTDSKYRYRVPVGLFLFLLLTYFFYYTFIVYFQALHIISGDYAYRYGTSKTFAAEEVGSLGLIKDSIITMSLLMIVYAARKGKSIPRDIIYMVSVLVVFNFMLSSMRIIMVYFFRLGYYMGLIMIIYLSAVIQSCKKRIFIFYSGLYIFLIITVMAAYRSYGFSPEGWVNNVYKSKILGIE